MEKVHPRTFHILDIQAVDAPTAHGAKEFKITFDKEIPSEIDSNDTHAIENLTWTPEVVFENNLIRNNRARGTLFSTPKKVIVENNLFDHTHGSAILLAGDANGWFETGMSKNVSIRKNTFINALTGSYQFTNAIISIYPEIPDLENQKAFFHKNVVIENNIFETFDRPLVYAKSIDGLIFKKNTIKATSDFKPFHWNTHSFFFEKADNIRIENNDFQYDFDPLKDIRIELSDSEAVKYIP